MDDFIGPILNSLAYEMMLYINMFGLIMVMRFFCEFHCTAVVEVDDGRIRSEVGESQFNEQVS